jgi:hypothetical protein
MKAGEGASGVMAAGFALDIIPAIDLMAAGTGEMFHHLNIPGFPAGFPDPFQCIINLYPVGHLRFELIEFFTGKVGAFATEINTFFFGATDHMTIAAVGSLGAGAATGAAYGILGDIPALRDEVQGSLIILLGVLVNGTGFTKYATYACQGFICVHLCVICVICVLFFALNEFFAFEDFQVHPSTKLRRTGRKLTDPNSIRKLADQIQKGRFPGPSFD